MTVSSQTSSETFFGNGVTTIWDLPFRFFKNEDIQAYLINPATNVTTPLVLGTDYTLTGAGLPEQFGTAPGKITTTTPVASGSELYVERVMNVEQLTDIINQGEFFPEIHEDVFDRLTMLLQQVDASGRGAIRVAIGDPEPARLPQASVRANQLMGFDALGNPIPVAPSSGDLNDFAIRLADSVNVSNGAGMVGWDGRPLSETMKTVRATDLSGNADKAQALIDFAASLNGQRGRVEPGTYTMTKQVSLPGNVDLDLTGVTLDFSAANVANFPDLICLRPAPGTLVQLPALSADTVIGTYSITFSAAHNLAPGDAIILHDDKPSSYSAFRTNYYQGQFAVVRSVSGLTVNLTAQILASMSIVLDGNGKGLKIYKMNPTRPKIRGGDILMPTSGAMVAGLMSDVGRNAQFEYVRVFGTSGAGIIHQRGLGCTSLFCETYSDRDVLTFDNYGHALSNSQHCLIYGGSYHARRHGITMGGTDLPGSVPTRFCVADNAETSSWDIQGSDMHGNVEHCQYVNCIHRNGVTISGNHNSVRGGMVFAPALAATGNGVAISINEMRGTSFLFEGFKIFADGDPSTTNRGVIDCGGNSTSMSADTILGGNMSFKNIDMSAPNARIPVKIVNRGSTAARRTIEIDINCPDSPSTRTANVLVQNASGNVFDRVRYRMDFPNIGAPAGTQLDATKVCGMRESGTVSTTTDAASVKDVSITFNRRFPKAPVVHLNGNVSASGVNVFYTPINVTVSGATLRVYTGGGAMTAGTAINLMWEAVLEE